MKPRDLGARSEQPSTWKSESGTLGQVGLSDQHGQSLRGIGASRRARHERHLPALPGLLAARLLRPPHGADHRIVMPEAKLAVLRLPWRALVVLLCGALRLPLRNTASAARSADPSGSRGSDVSRQVPCILVTALSGAVPDRSCSVAPRAVPE